jgi:two-component system NtrC family sensor kinase
VGALFHPLSVKSKAALVTTAGVLVLFATFAVFEMHRVQAEMQAVLGAQQLTLLSSIADELDDKVRSTHKALIVTAEATTPKMLADPPALERNLRDQPGYRSLFDDVFVIGRDGRVLIDLPVLKRRGIDVHDRDYFRGTLDTRKPVISAPYMGRGLKEPSVTMTAPILDRKGEVAGMLTGVIHPLKANFLGKLREARVGATGRSSYPGTWTAS